jgi:carbonic anhydrase
MERLLAGYRRFRENGWPRQRALFESLAEHGQRPQTLVVGCVDSRVDPAVIFDAAPGEILTVRNVANLVPPYAPDAAYHGTSAALEFGVTVLEVRNLVVLGHGLCGGVRALLAQTPAKPGNFISTWMSIAESARARTLESAPPEQHQHYCEHEVIKVSLANLMTFPWIAERVAAGRLALYGAWFSVMTGSLLLLQPDGSFVASE